MNAETLATARSQAELVALAEAAGVEVRPSWSRPRLAKALLEAEVDVGPDGLGPAGSELWARITADGLVMRPDEREVLRQACRVADMISRLEEVLDSEPAMVPGSAGQMVLHPLIAEVRQERALMANLLGRIDVPEEGDEVGGQWNHLTASERARKAAHARWKR